MALSTWPPELPQQFVIESFSRKAPENRVRTKVEGAVPKLRRRYSNIAEPFSGDMIMTTAQRNAFWSYYKNTLKHGTLAFNFPEPAVTDGTMIICQFSDDLPSEQALSHTHWQISFGLDQIR